MDNEYIGAVFSSLQKLVEMHGSKKTSEILAQCLFVGNISVLPDQPIYNAVIDCVCAEYGTTPQQLISTNEKGIIQNARQMLCAILHFNYRFTVRSISFCVFNKKHFSFVQKGIKKHREITENKSNKGYLEKYERIINNINSLLKPTNNTKQNGADIH